MEYEKELKDFCKERLWLKYEDLSECGKKSIMDTMSFQNYLLNVKLREFGQAFMKATGLDKFF